MANHSSAYPIIGASFNQDNSSSLLAIVGAGEQPSLSPRRLCLFNTTTGAPLREMTFLTSILSVRLNRKRLVVVLLEKTYIYDTNSLSMLDTIDTVSNSKGLCAFSPSLDGCFLALPASTTKGAVLVYNVMELQLHWLQLNLVKSRIFGINLQDQIVGEWAESIGCLRDSFPTEYLGLPLGAKRNSIQLWDPIVKKLYQKLAGWKVSSLSMAGRTVLIKSVLNSLPNYYMSMFKMPVVVRKKLESIMANFLWGSSAEKKRALMGKWVWKFGSEKDSWLKTMICSKYNVGTSSIVLDDNLPSNVSWIWKGVVNNYRTNDSFGLCFRNNVVLQVGKGDSIRFWHDSWISNYSLKSMFSRIFALSVNKEGVVADFGCMSNEEWVWDLQLRRNLMDSEFDQWMEMMVLLDNFKPLLKGEDRLAWKGSGDGVYSVQSCSRLVSSLSESDNSWLEIVWKGFVPPKVEIFIWQIIHQKFVVKTVLMRRGVRNIESPLCVLCGVEPESVRHLFFSCVQVWQIWVKLLRMWKVNSVLPNNPKGFLLSWPQLRANSCIWRFIPGAVLWVISWFLAKNKDVSIQVDSLVGDLTLADLHKSPSNFRSSRVKWCPPPTDTDKNRLVSFYRALGPCSPILAEIFAIKVGLEVFFESVWTDKGFLILESDSFLVVKWINNPKLCPVHLVDLITEIQKTVVQSNVIIKHISRCTNVEADCLAKSRIGTIFLLPLVVSLQEATMREIDAHRSPLAAIALSSSGKYIATASEQGTIIRVHLVLEATKIFLQPQALQVLFISSLWGLRQIRGTLLHLKIETNRSKKSGSFLGSILPDSVNDALDPAHHHVLHNAVSAGVRSYAVVRKVDKVVDSSSSEIALCRAVISLIAYNGYFQEYTFTLNSQNESTWSLEREFNLLGVSSVLPPLFLTPTPSFPNNSTEKKKERDEINSQNVIVEHQRGNQWFPSEDPIGESGGEGSRNQSRFPQEHISKDQSDASRIRGYHELPEESPELSVLESDI
ncbi:Autophagy-related protein 18b [Hibiscus syriacus]|uniref:Autophagy-related protein 18b n=1 Tax=Hibiscus syriacus TaxID=106335 RepID=A0A6A3AP36_HIBSY|nr:Autophagy-related protein 18b [Hibiscus syriacus]